MVRIIDRSVNSVRIQTNPDRTKEAQESAPEAPTRRRMGVVERERQILDGAIQFFSVHGFNGQLRDLAKSIGVTHALLYHYFPTKQALVDRVYLEVFEGRRRADQDVSSQFHALNPRVFTGVFVYQSVNNGTNH